MKKVIVEMGLKGQMVMEIPEDNYRRGEFFIPVAKNVGIQSWAENMEASDETTTKKLVFRRYGDDTFRLVGWED